MREITRASWHEASKLPSEAMSFHELVYLKVCSVENKDRESIDISDADLSFEECEDMLLKLNEMKRYKRIVGSIVGSCLNVDVPLLGSMTES
ncbi:hypothetical protein IHE45_02G062300 [Dioscorea alata]|uniref:Uncharacterized protein n=1 Tax=Dioscorea alata TaxID=55571 RepID=A0ACB7WQN8_DIOAL|nr:hypothetical protein IHE45_02G062300 [Dioscorea alata]